MPRVRLPDCKVALVEPDWAGKLSGFTLLFEALVLMLAQQMPFAAVARVVGETWHRVHAICVRYVDLALERADLSAVDAVAIDETSYKRGCRRRQQRVRGPPGLKTALGVGTSPHPGLSDLALETEPFWPTFVFKTSACA